MGRRMVLRETHYLPRYGGSADDALLASRPIWANDCKV